MQSGRKRERKDDTLIKQLNEKYAGDKLVPYMGNANLPSDKSEFEYDKDRVSVIMRCHENILYFAQHFFYVVSRGKKEKISLHEYQRRGLRLFQNYNKNIFNTSRQCGKALALDTPIPTPSGWTTMGEIVDGDIIYGSDGNPTTVKHAWDVMYNRPCYEMTFDTGEKIIADEGHYWETETQDGITSKKTTLDIYNTLKCKFKSNHRISACKKFHTVDYNYIVNVTPVASVPVRCITVDNANEMFLCGKTYIKTKNTTLMTIYALWLTTFFEYRHVLIVANKEDTAKEILSRVKLAYEELPNWIKPTVKGWGKQSVEFTNGSQIKISATSSDAARGQSINALLLDEAAHIDENILKSFWSAVKPTVSADPNAKVLISSTPNGVGNLFHDLWEKSENPENGWGNLEVKWDEIPGRTEEWAKGELGDLGQDMFDQEYNCKFLESGESFIPEGLYNELQRSCRAPRMDFDGGTYKIFEEPDLENKFYCAGVDIGEGVGACNSTICILDITELTEIKQVATYASNDVGPHEFARKLHEILKHWGKPPTAIERNNSGGGVVINQMDKEYRYPNLVNFAIKQGKRDYSHLKGVTSATNTKYHGVMNMFYWVKTHRRVILRDIDTLKELNTFTRHKNEKWAKKSNSYKDDRVDAMLWALACIHEMCVIDFFTVTAWDDNRKPFQLQPLYEQYGRRDSAYRVGNEDNNWGADVMIIPSMGNNDAFITEAETMGWLLPEQDSQREWKSHVPSPYQFL